MNTINGHCEYYNNVTLLIFIFLYQIGCPVENIHISFVSSALALNFFPGKNFKLYLGTILENLFEIRK